MINIICEKNVFDETFKLHQNLYKYILYRKETERKKTVLNNIGDNIYKTICFSD